MYLGRASALLSLAHHLQPLHHSRCGRLPHYQLLFHIEGQRLSPVPSAVEASIISSDQFHKTHDQMTRDAVP